MPLFRNVYFWLFCLFYSSTILPPPAMSVQIVGDPCKDMKILFWGETSEKPSPFQVTAGKYAVKAGEIISATISSIEGIPYKAFLLQARNDKGESFGDFKQTNNTAVYSCHSGRFDMAANNDFRKKLKNVVYWISPKNIAENTTVRFVLTAMKGKNEYWTGIKSKPFTVICNDTLRTQLMKKYFPFFRLPSFLRWYPR